MSQVLTTTRRGLLLGAASTALLASTQSSLMRAATAQSRDALVTTETVVNFADHASPGYVRLGLQFTKGEIPSGSTPQLARNGAAIAGVQFDERVSWSDGSLKNCVCHIRDAEWSGNESRSYQVTAVPGGYDNVGTKTLRDITSTHDFSVVFSNVKDHQDAAYGSGTFLAKFNIQSAKSTRVYKYHSGPVCESWEVWGMATDAADGMPDAHLKTIWYVSVWKDDHGAVADYEFGAVVALDWWDKTNLGPNARPKSALSYIAELKDGAKTINTYELGSVVSTHSYHPYQSQWMTVRTDDDDNHARRYWVTQIPTLMRNFDKRHAISTGFFPPLDTSWSPRSNVELRYTANYTPCGGVNHRTDINATGGYVGRGLLPNMDCITFMSQTAQNLRSSRTSAFAGLHIPYHFKSSHSRTIAAGPQAGTDLANTVIAMKMQNLSPPALYDFTAGGMPAAMYAYTNNLTPVTYDPPKGGIGVWSSVQSRPSHAVAYSYFMYLIEGERHFMQANLELATNAVHQQSGNQYGGEPYYTFHGEEPYQSIFKIPATRYGAICCVADDNNRATGWGIMLTTYAAAVCPDADVQSRFIRLLQKNQTLFVYNDLKYMPQGMKDIGWYGAGLGMSPFSGAIQVQGVATAVRLAEDANALSMLNSCFQNEPLGAFTPGQFYRSDIYRASCT